MKCGIILSCYDRVDDLLAHLDILKFNPHGPKIMVAYMHHDEPPAMPDGVELIRLPSPGFTSGPLLSITRGVMRAADLGLDYLTFRNADDWMFNHDMAQEWISHLDRTGLVAAGYNWFTVGTMNDITMNENILKVDAFAPSAATAERYFLRSDQAYNCEYKMAWWVRRVTKSDHGDGFFRLPDREAVPGIGWEAADVPKAYEKFGTNVPVEVWGRLEYNNRFFNRKWQMIGSHDNQSRLFHWRQIRSAVPYAEELEKCHHFGRWLDAATNNLTWNKTEVNESRNTRQRRIKPIRTSTQMPRILLRSKVSS